MVERLQATGHLLILNRPGSQIFKLLYVITCRENLWK